MQTSQENNRGVILADFQVENELRDGGRVSSRQAQLRFELERGAKGWKIVNLDPACILLIRESRDSAPHLPQLADRVLAMR